MRHVDLICAEEDLPMIGLLQDHLLLQQITVRVHTEMPAQLSEPTLVIAGADFEPATLVVPWLAVYLKHGPRLPGAIQHIDITSWPARSSDHDVARLVAFLQSASLSRTNLSQERRASKAQGGRDGPDRQNLTAIGVLLFAVLVIFLLPDNPEQNSTEENVATTDADHQTSIEQSIPAQSSGLNTSATEPFTAHHQEQSRLHPDPADDFAKGNAGELIQPFNLSSDWCLVDNPHSCLICRNDGF